MPMLFDPISERMNNCINHHNISSITVNPLVINKEALTVDE